MTGDELNDRVAALVPWAADRARRRRSWPWFDFDAAFSVALEAAWRGVLVTPPGGDPTAAAAVVYDRRRVEAYRRRAARKRGPDWRADPAAAALVPSREPCPSAALVAREAVPAALRLAAGFAAEDAAWDRSGRVKAWRARRRADGLPTQTHRPPRPVNSFRGEIERLKHSFARETA